MNKPEIKIAVLGPGNISHRFMEGMKYVSDARVTAFGSRRPDSVSSYASQYGVELICPPDELIASGAVQAAYISTPNHVHADQIRSCLEHGLHVLCEKPITVKKEEYLDLLELAHTKKLVLMEAQKTLYTPVFQAMKQLLDKGELGAITSAEAGFCRNEGLTEDAWRMNAPGKGALYDVGCYPLAAVFGLFGCGFRELGRSVKYVRDTDVGGEIRLSDSTKTVSVHYSCTEDGLCGLNITGTAGSLSCPEFWKARSFTLTKNGTADTRSFPFESEFTFEAQRFVQRILQEEITDTANEAITAAVLEILQR